MWHAWRTGEAHTGFWWGDMREREHLEDLGVDRRKILKLILKKEDGGGAWIGLIWLSDSGYGQVEGCCECGNEPSGCITRAEYFD